MSSNLSVLIGLGLVLASGVAMSWFLSRRKKWCAIGKLSKIYIYPIKSGKYRMLNEAECTPLGLRYCIGDSQLYIRDRVFIVYNADTMFLMCSKFNEKMLHLDVELKDDKTAILSYPGRKSIEITMPDKFDNKMVEIWQQEKIRISDCGDEAAKWISEVLIEQDSGYRLGYWPENETWRRDWSFQKIEFKVFKYMNNKHLGAFSDVAGYHVINNSSIEDLNTRLEDNDKTVALNFRPNFVIEGPKPYEEDKWHWIKIGDVVLEAFRPCTRCLAITIDAETSKKNERMEPLKELRKYRTMKMLGEERVEPSIPVMGIFAGLHKGGKVKCGDTVYVSN